MSQLSELMPWMKLFSSYTSPFLGYTSSYQAFEKIKHKFEVSTNTCFILRYTEHKGIKEAGKFTTNGHHIRFEDRKHNKPRLLSFIETDNVPFICKNMQIFCCHRGKGYKNKHQVITPDDHDYNKIGKKRIIRKTKKQDCEARIAVREIIRFPDFRIEKNTAAMKRKASQQLRMALKEVSDKVRYEKRYYIHLPDLSEHNHSLSLSENYVQVLDKRLRDQIYLLVRSGLTKTMEIKQNLIEFLNTNKEDWFTDGYYPSILNKRFYPNNHTIRNHINLAEKKLRRSKMKEDKQQQISNGCYKASCSNDAYLSVMTDIIHGANDESPDKYNGSSVNMESAVVGGSQRNTGCRDLIRKLTLKTYEMDDKIMLRELNKKLEQLLSRASTQTPVDDDPFSLASDTATNRFAVSIDCRDLLRKLNFTIYETDDKTSLSELRRKLEELHLWVSLHNNDNTAKTDEVKLEQQDTGEVSYAEEQIEIIVLNGEQ